MDNKARIIPFINQRNTRPERFKDYEELIYDDIMLKIRELVNNKVEEQKCNQRKVAPHIIELERKCECMKNNLENCIPYHSIIYLCINAILFGGALTLLILNLFLDITIIPIYYVFCGIIISSGLFFTALASLKDWRCFLNNVK